MWFERVFLQIVILQVTHICLTIEKSSDASAEPSDQFLRDLFNDAVETAGSKFLDDVSEFNVREFPDATPELGSTYDFVIIGGGTAGCVLAARLSEIKKATVLLLEAGGHEKFLYSVPFIADDLTNVDYLSWGYESEPSDQYCRGMKNHQCRLPRAKVLGGCNVHNTLILTRGTDRDYDEWAELGNTGWDWQSVFPYFKKLESMKIPELREDDVNHNTKGPFPVSYTGLETDLSKAFRSAGEELGYDSIDYNGKSRIGFSRLQYNMINSERYTTNRAYLHPKKNRKNLHVSLHSLINKILINEKKQAWGVEFTKKNKTYIVKARKEVILSAGAMGSPQILMLSGIGPEEHLKELDIGVIKNASVGKNLMDHIAYGGLAFLINETLGFDPNDLNNRSVVSQYFNDRQGVLTLTAGSESVGYVDVINTNKRDGYPNAELLFTSTSFAGSTSWRDNFAIKDEIFDRNYAQYSGVSSWTIRALLMKPKSRGEILLSSKNINDLPKIIPNYLSDSYDVKVLVAAARRVIEISQTQAMQKYESRLVNVSFDGCDQYEHDSDMFWECAIRTITITFFHYSGTCKMGPKDDSSAVVDPNLKVIGIDNLRVIDASIMPTIISGHSNLPTVMIAEKGADIIKKAWGYPVDPLP